MATVVVGLSGGVDSAVTAFLLKQQGHNVIALFMRNWNDASPTLENECPWIEDSRDAMLVADYLNIPFQLIDLSAAYYERIVSYMFAEYEAGRTPNPDILCNREIKFDLFLQEALKLNADFIATGHYAQVQKLQKNNQTYFQLLQGIDETKNQSYFLCQLNQYQLSKAIFPIGNLTKTQVRQIAKDNNLPVASKKDSQGLCFIGHVSLPQFLQQKLQAKQGVVIEIPNTLEAYTGNYNSANNKISYNPTMGKEIGKHQGAHFYTIGQRKGLNLGGTPLPLFVLQTDTLNNIVYVGQGENHLGLMHLGTFVANKDVHWVRPDLALHIGDKADYMVQIRYRQTLFPAQLQQTEKGLNIHFKNTSKALAPGQFIAWFLNNELIGSGIMDN